MRTILFALLLSLSSTSFSETLTEKLKPATSADLIGYWRVIPIDDSKQPIKMNPWPGKCQHIQFTESKWTQAIERLGNGNDIPEDQCPNTLSAIEAKFQLAGESSNTWKPLNDYFVTYDATSKMSYLWGATMVTGDVSTPNQLGVEVKQGDLFMVALNQARKPVFVRLLRKITTP